MSLGMGGNWCTLGHQSLLEARFSQEQCPAAAPPVLQDSVWEKGSNWVNKERLWISPGASVVGPPDTEEESGCLQRSKKKKKKTTLILGNNLVLLIL